jgi:hypothetical protein
MSESQPGEAMSESQPGLRNPAAAVRGAGAGALVTEAIVLLLAIAPLARIGGVDRGAAIGLVVALAVAAGLLAGLLRHPWAWWAGLVVPVGLLAGGWLHWSLGALGVVFGLLWVYMLSMRHTVFANRPS